MMVVVMIIIIIIIIILPCVRLLRSLLVITEQNQKPFVIFKSSEISVSCSLYVKILPVFVRAHSFTVLNPVPFFFSKLCHLLIFSCFIIYSFVSRSMYFAFIIKEWWYDSNLNNGRNIILVSEFLIFPSIVKTLT